jgi:hypothetical protein
VVVIVVMWGKCVLVSFLRIWVVLGFRPSYYGVKAILFIVPTTLRLFIRGFGYSNFMLCICIHFPVMVLWLCYRGPLYSHGNFPYPMSMSELFKNALKLKIYYLLTEYISSDTGSFLTKIIVKILQVTIKHKPSTFSHFISRKLIELQEILYLIILYEFRDFHGGEYCTMSN